MCSCLYLAVCRSCLSERSLSVRLFAPLSCSLCLPHFLSPSFCSGSDCWPGCCDAFSVDAANIQEAQIRSWVSVMVRPGIQAILELSISLGKFRTITNTGTPYRQMLKVRKKQNDFVRILFIIGSLCSCHLLQYSQFSTP